MLGMGPGSLASDAKMMGIPVAKQRDMMDEGDRRACSSAAR